LREKVSNTIKQYTLFQPGQKVLVATSGGPDSLSLLHLLHRMADALGITLHVAHINHGLRPEAAAEAVAVKKQAILLGLPVSVSRVDVKSLQEKGLSLQTAARYARYGALVHLAKRVGAERIATAHHRDDRVETMLMRLLSGCGLDGLAGIPVRRRLLHGIEVVRPFFNVSREEIEQYCEINRLIPLMDPSNERPVYLRNRVRLQLIPHLEREFGEHVRRTLRNTADNLTLDATFLYKLGKQAFLDVTESRGKDGVWLDTVSFHKLHPALQKRVVRHALWQAGVRRPGRLHVEQIGALAGHKMPSAQCTLPDGVMAQRIYSKLWLGTSPPEATAIGAIADIQVPGRTYLTCCNRWLLAETHAVHEIDLAKLSPQEACLDFEKLNPAWPLNARTRRDGDRMHPLGAPGSRKVKKILADRKIPLGERDRIPIIVSGDQIIWLGGVEIAEDYKVTADTEVVLSLKLITEEKDGAN
jgi:tRNA(Ile)-lysidine synthase